MNELIIKTTAAPVYQNRKLQSATNRILKIGETVRKYAFETAAIMAKVDESQCYLDDGFKNVHEWAMSSFGFKKSASYSLLKIGKEYTRAALNGAKEVYGSNLLPEGVEKDFSTAQVEKMLPGGHELAVTLAGAEEITPDMTCKEIAAIIKEHTTQVDAEPETADAEPETADAEPETADAGAPLVEVVDAEGIVYRVPLEILEKYRV